MSRRWLRPAVWLIVLAGVALNLTLSWSLWRSLYQNWQVGLEDDAKTTGKIIEDEIQTYVLGLEGARGALIADRFKFDPGTFRKYAESRQLFKNFAGALGFGFIRAVKPADLKDYERRMQLARSGFRVHPSSQNGMHMVIELIEPAEDNGPAIGLDISFEKYRREAAEEAAHLERHESCHRSARVGLRAGGSGSDIQRQPGKNPFRKICLGGGTRRQRQFFSRSSHQPQSLDQKFCEPENSCGRPLVEFKGLSNGRWIDSFRINSRWGITFGRGHSGRNRLSAGSRDPPSEPVARRDHQQFQLFRDCHAAGRDNLHFQQGRGVHVGLPGRRSSWPQKSFDYA